MLLAAPAFTSRVTLRERMISTVGLFSRKGGGAFFQGVSGPRGAGRRRPGGRRGLDKLVYTRQVGAPRWSGPDRRTLPGRFRPETWQVRHMPPARHYGREVPAR